MYKRKGSFKRSIRRKASRRSSRTRSLRLKRYGVQRGGARM